MEIAGPPFKIKYEVLRGVNRDVVSLEDFLSDSVYFCHMDTGEVELCSDR